MYILYISNVYSAACVGVLLKAFPLLFGNSAMILTYKRSKEADYEGSSVLGTVHETRIDSVLPGTCIPALNLERQ